MSIGGPNRPFGGNSANFRTNTGNVSSSSSNQANTIEETIIRPSVDTDQFDFQSSSLRSRNLIGRTPAVQERTSQIIDSFTDRIETILHHDAGSLAAGHTPVREGDTLTSAQQDQLKDAATDLIKEMPVGALSPDGVAKAKTFLESRGVDTTNIETKNIKEFGRLAGDLAKELVKDLRTDKPSAFYALATGAAVAIGAVGYAKGSDGLKKLGVKPQFSTKLFNDSISLKAKATWDRHFENPNAVITAESTRRFNALSLSVGADLDIANMDRSTGRLDARVGNDQNYFGAGVTTSANGNTTFRANAGMRVGDITQLTASGNATFNNDFDFETGNVSFSTQVGQNGRLDINTTFNDEGLHTVSSNARYSTNNFSVTGDVTHDFVRDATTTSLSAGYTPTEDLEFGLRGSYDSERGGHVGVGVTWNF